MLRGAAGLTGSLAVHGAVAGLLVVFMQPPPLRQQPSGSSEVAISSIDVTRQSADVQSAEGERAANAEAGAARLGQGAIAESRAQSVLPTASPLPARAAPSQNVELLPGVTAEGASIGAVSPLSQSAAPLTAAQGAALSPVGPVGSDVLAQVPVSDAVSAAEALVATAALAAAPVSDRISAATAPAARARPLANPGGKVTASPSDAAIAVSALPAPATTPSAIVPAAAIVTASLASSEDAAVAIAPEMALAVSVAPRAELVVAAAAPGVASLAETALADVVAPAAPADLAGLPAETAGAEGLPVAALDRPAAPAPFLAAAGARQDGQATTGQSAPERPAPASQLVASALPALAGKATLAWSGAAEQRFDPVSLAAVQAFMSPGVAAADTLRDGLSGLLRSIPCARLQAEFLPDSGVLEVRGHIPDPALQAGLVSLLGQSVGSAIPVRPALRVLPAPQCQALSALDDVGLPQSSDSRSDARLVGRDGFARVYELVEGQFLSFEITGADTYEAHFYADYFDADGNVIHLVPNTNIPLPALDPGEALMVGGEDWPIRFEVTAPFNKEIVVIFASSRPLYEGVRPLVEPAGPYLDWLAARVAEARAADPAFKGEWAYVFISPEPRPQ